MGADWCRNMLTCRALDACTRLYATHVLLCISKHKALQRDRQMQQFSSCCAGADKQTPLYNDPGRNADGCYENVAVQQTYWYRAPFPSPSKFPSPLTFLMLPFPPLPSPPGIPLPLPLSPNPKPHAAFPAPCFHSSRPHPLHTPKTKLLCDTHAYDAQH